MLGFNFYVRSSRYIEPKLAAEIIAQLFAVQNVGVFVNAEPAEIEGIANHVGLDAVQLHGDETVEFVSQIRELLPDSIVIKAVRVGPGFVSNKVGNFGADHLLLDNDAGERFGGSGTTFDWSRASDIDGLILAGGLTPENVADAIRTVRPYAVDVASGVEASPGKKDPRRVKAFIRNAKNA
jgi:phosphoribosylanthranilate isomerase